MNFLRSAVSGKRNRYRDGEFDLDLSYITPRIIAMAFPAAGTEGMYRNNIADVARFLNKKHGSSYMVFNLSERHYDTAYFEHRVMPLGFPDHHAPPVEVAWTVCRTMHGWLSAAPENVAVVHCLAGKGRTGVIIACYMIFSGQTLPPPVRLPAAVWDAEVAVAAAAEAESSSTGTAEAAPAGSGLRGGVCIARPPAILGGSGLARLPPQPAATAPSSSMHRAGAGAGAATSLLRGAGARPLAPIQSGWVPPVHSPAAPTAGSAAGAASAATSAFGLGRAKGHVAAAHVGSALSPMSTLSSTVGRTADATHSPQQQSPPSFALAPSPLQRAGFPPVSSASTAFPKTSHVVTVAAAAAAATSGGTPGGTGGGGGGGWSLKIPGASPSGGLGGVGGSGGGRGAGGPDPAGTAVIGGFSVLHVSAAPPPAAAAGPGSVTLSANGVTAGGPQQQQQQQQHQQQQQSSPPQQQHLWLVLPTPAATAQDTLAIFRCQRGDGVNYPSQERTVRYFALVMHHAIVAEHCAMLRAEAGLADHVHVPRAAAAAAAADTSASEGESGGSSGGGSTAAGGDVDPALLRLQAYLECFMADPAYSDRPLLVRAEAAANLTRMRRLPLPPRTQLHTLRVILPRSMLLPGGFTPQLKITTAPYQGAVTKTLFNSSWHSPQPVTYGAGDGPIVFKVDAVLQGDVFISCRQLPAGHTLFYCSFHTAFVRHDKDLASAAATAAAGGASASGSVGGGGHGGGGWALPGVYRLGLADLDMEHRKSAIGAFPPDFSLDLCYRELPAAREAAAVTAAAVAAAAGAAQAREQQPEPLSASDAASRVEPAPVSYVQVAAAGAPDRGHRVGSAGAGGPAEPPRRASAAAAAASSVPSNNDSNDSSGPGGVSPMPPEVMSATEAAAGGGGGAWPPRVEAAPPPPPLLSVQGLADAPTLHAHRRASAPHAAAGHDYGCRVATAGGTDLGDSNSVALRPVLASASHAQRRGSAAAALTPDLPSVTELRLHGGTSRRASEFSSVPTPRLLPRAVAPAVHLHDASHLHSAPANVSDCSHALPGHEARSDSQSPPVASDRLSDDDYRDEERSDSDDGSGDGGIGEAYLQADEEEGDVSAVAANAPFHTAEGTGRAFDGAEASPPQQSAAPSAAASGPPSPSNAAATGRAFDSSGKVVISFGTQKVAAGGGAPAGGGGGGGGGSRAHGGAGGRPPQPKRGGRTAAAAAPHTGKRGSLGAITGWFEGDGGSGTSALAGGAVTSTAVSAFPAPVGGSRPVDPRRGGDSVAADAAAAATAEAAAAAAALVSDDGEFERQSRLLPSEARARTAVAGSGVTAPLAAAGLSSGGPAAGVLLQLTSARLAGSSDSAADGEERSIAGGATTVLAPPWPSTLDGSASAAVLPPPLAAASAGDPNVLMMGYLVKQGGLVHNWRRRWCVLRRVVSRSLQQPPPVPVPLKSQKRRTSDSAALLHRTASAESGGGAGDDEDDDAFGDASPISRPGSAAAAAAPGAPQASSAWRDRRFHSFGGGSTGALSTVSSGALAAGALARDATVAVLDYYAQSSDAAPRGALTLTAPALAGVSLVMRGSAAASKVQNRPRVLEVKSGGRPFFLQAGADDELRAWLGAFRALAAEFDSDDYEG